MCEKLDIKIPVLIHIVKIDLDRATCAHINFFDFYGEEISVDPRLRNTRIAELIDGVLKGKRSYRKQSDLARTD